MRFIKHKYKESAGGRSQESNEAKDIEGWRLKNATNNMEKHIKRNGSRYIIENPVMREENFAEKWNEKPEKAHEFFYWLNRAKADILQNPVNAQGLHRVAEKLECCFGKSIVRKSMIEAGESMREARENKSLYVDGLLGGLRTSPTETSKKVGGHTFFGE